MLNHGKRLDGQRKCSVICIGTALTHSGEKKFTSKYTAGSVSSMATKSVKLKAREAEKICLMAPTEEKNGSE